MLKEVSFRLGMEGGLNLGICLGIIAMSSIMIVLLLLIYPAATLAIILSIAFIIAGSATGALILWMQGRRRASSEPFCTCRFRKNFFTFCRECALKDTDTSQSSQKLS